MDANLDGEGQRAVRELVARFAEQCSGVELTQLAGRLLRDARTRPNWEALVGEVVACAVYNQISLLAAEDLVLRAAQAPAPADAANSGD